MRNISILHQLAAKHNLSAHVSALAAARSNQLQRGRRPAASWHAAALLTK